MLNRVTYIIIILIFINLLEDSFADINSLIIDPDNHPESFFLSVNNQWQTTITELEADGLIAYQRSQAGIAKYIFSATGIELWEQPLKKDIIEYEDVKKGTYQLIATSQFKPFDWKTNQPVDLNFINNQVFAKKLNQRSAFSCPWGEVHFNYKNKQVETELIFHDITDQPRKYLWEINILQPDKVTIAWNDFKGQSNYLPPWSEIQSEMKANNISATTGIHQIWFYDDKGISGNVVIDPSLSLTQNSSFIRVESDTDPGYYIEWDSTNNWLVTDLRSPSDSNSNLHYYKQGDRTWMNYWNALIEAGATTKYMKVIGSSNQLIQIRGHWDNGSLYGSNIFTCLPDRVVKWQQKMYCTSDRTADVRYNWTTLDDEDIDLVFAIYDDDVISATITRLTHYTFAPSNFPTGVSNPFGSYYTIKSSTMDMVWWLAEIADELDYGDQYGHDGYQDGSSILGFMGSHTVSANTNLPYVNVITFTYTDTDNETTPGTSPQKYAQNWWHPDPIDIITSGQKINSASPFNPNVGMYELKVTGGDDRAKFEWDSSTYNKYNPALKLTGYDSSQVYVWVDDTLQTENTDYLASKIVYSGTATSTNGNFLYDTSTDSPLNLPDDYFIGTTIITSGGAGSYGLVIDSTSSNQAIEVEAWTGGTPSATETYEITDILFLQFLKTFSSDNQTIEIANNTNSGIELNQTNSSSAQNWNLIRETYSGAVQEASSSAQMFDYLDSQAPGLNLNSTYQSPALMFKQVE